MGEAPWLPQWRLAYKMVARLSGRAESKGVSSALLASASVSCKDFLIIAAPPHLFLSAPQCLITSFNYHIKPAGGSLFRHIWMTSSIVHL